MSKSRRDFLIGLAASSATLAVPSIPRTRASVHYPASVPFFFTMNHVTANIRIGYASITWEGDDGLAIKDISSLGYPGIQLRANILTEYPDPHALRDLLAQHQLKFVAFSSGTAPLDPALRQSTIDIHVKNARYLHEAGGNYLQIVGGSATGNTYSKNDIEYEGQLLTEIARRVADFGIQTGFHNHMGTIGQTPEAVDAILAATDPRYVKLELDIGHYVQSGGNPASCIRKHGHRLLFLHLKDVRNVPTKSGYTFTELGEGRVDFAAVFTALHSINFQGWGIVELDNEPRGASRTPKHSAEISKNYLEKMGIRV